MGLNILSKLSLCLILDKMKRVKQKNEFHPLSTKYRALMYVERECKPGLTHIDQAQAASNYIGDQIKVQTWRNWLNKKQDIIEQVNLEGGLIKKRKFKRTKVLIKADQKNFESEIGVRLVQLFQTRNLTIENAQAEAKRIKQEKYPNLTFHRMPCTGYGRAYIRSLLRRLGWSWKRILGSMTPVPVETLKQADSEFGECLKRFKDDEVGNIDESSMLLSHCGKYSFVPNVKTVTRAINALDDKQRITWCRVILKSGTSDHCNFLIDKNVPRGLKVVNVDKSAKISPSLTDKESKKAEKSKWSLYSFKSNYLATNSNAFMTRALFRRYLTLYNNFLRSKKKKKILLMDRLRAHIMDWPKYKEWRKTTSKVVYIDNESFSHLELAYLPANSTGLCQPCDLTSLVRKCL